MSATPAVSVVVPAHNAARWLRETLDSVIAQTVSELEVVVVDDASSDDTAGVVGAVADPRVRLIRHDRNLGPAQSRNTGIDAARGEFIAFLDADDLALPRRLERQVAFLRAHPDVAVCGGWMQTFGRRDDIWPAHQRHDDIKAELLYACGLLQSTVMCRRDALLRHGLRYDPAIGLSEDYDLWTRCADVLRLANLPEVLVRYRTHGDNISLTKRDRLVAANRTIRMRQLGKLGVQPSEAEAELHDRLFGAGPGGPGLRDFDLDAVERWLLRLREANRRSGYVPDRALWIVLYEFWRRCALAGGSRLSLKGLKFLRSPVVTGLPVTWPLRDVTKMLLGLPLYPLQRA